MSSTYLSIHTSVVFQIQQHCLEQLPAEGCGILAGSGHIIDHFFPIPNLDDSPSSFQFEPHAYLNTVRHMRQEKLDWIGVVHSHPNAPPYPSARDLANWHYPEKSYWILSLQKDQYRLCAYQIKEGQITPLLYEVLSTSDSPS